MAVFVFGADHVIYIYTWIFQVCNMSAFSPKGRHITHLEDPGIYNIHI